MTYLFYGGIFISPTDEETLRAAAYKYYKLDPFRKGRVKPHVMMMTRSKVAGNLPGRRIANQEQLATYLRRGDVHSRWRCDV